VIIPDLPAFAELPSTASMKYAPGLPGLRDALRAAGTLPSPRLREIGATGRAVAASVGWPEIAASTADAIRDVLANPSADRERSARVSAPLARENGSR
jgi:hypothetical protein